MVQNKISEKSIEKIYFSKILKDFKRFYYIYLGIFFLGLTVVNYFIKLIPIEYSGYILLTAFICFSVRTDINLEVNSNHFFIIALPFMAVILLIFFYGNDLWHGVLRWETGKNLFNLNDFFNKIPFNDTSFARIYQPNWLTEYMKVVYNTGFVLTVIAPLFRALLAMDFKKMVKYTLSAHIFQVFIITPFYFAFFLQEIWFVRGHADMLGRNLVGAEAIQTTMNCFPSMHTSIAFAMFLLVLRERNRLFKWVWGIYCLSVIYSTMYLEIHWLIDVIGGLILGYATVKLVDYVVSKTEKIIPERFININLGK